MRVRCVGARLGIVALISIASLEVGTGVAVGQSRLYVNVVEIGSGTHSVDHGYGPIVASCESLEWNRDAKDWDLKWSKKADKGNCQAPWFHDGGYEWMTDGTWVANPSPLRGRGNGLANARSCVQSLIAKCVDRSHVVEVTPLSVHNAAMQALDERWQRKQKELDDAMASRRDEIITALNAVSAPDQSSQVLQDVLARVQALEEDLKSLRLRVQGGGGR